MDTQNQDTGILLAGILQKSLTEDWKKHRLLAALRQEALIMSDYVMYDGLLDLEGLSDNKKREVLLADTGWIPGPPEIFDYRDLLGILEEEDRCAAAILTEDTDMQYMGMSCGHPDEITYEARFADEFLEY